MMHAWPRLHFGRLLTKLSVLYTGLFALALALLGVTAQVLIWNHAQTSVKAELVASGSVYDGLWALRAKTLGDNADVVAHDFGFRAAVATGDTATIASSLSTLRNRAGVKLAMIVEADGHVIGAPPALAGQVAQVAAELRPGRRDAVMVTNGGVYRVVVSSIMAPMRIGSVVFALPLDQTEMRALQNLSPIPLVATMLHRDLRGHWVSADALVTPDATVDALVRASLDQRSLAMLSLPGGRAFALAKPLTGSHGDVRAALLITYPLSAALAPYLPLQIGLGVTGLLGVLLVVIASIRLARGIASPIAALDAAARSLEEGARTEVAVVGHDEIARLAESFNRMSTGIIERENRISHLAFHDSLTGLPNRTYFRQALDQAIGRGGAAPRGPVAVLCLDLDGFKGVNDTLGHPVGDALLRGIGDILGELAPDCLVSRLGGDEYAIILSGGFDADRPRALAQAIIDRVARPMQAEGHQIATGFSIGIAIGPEDGRDPDQLLKNADLALYRAKRDGRGVFRFFEASLDAAARRRRQLELDLRAALRTGQFRLNFQPIFDLKADRIGGFEALLRWNHPTRGEVGPTEFIPVAEDTGLIVAIGAWVMQEACRQATTWPDHVRVAVNVSPLQFRNSGFQALILQALAGSGLAPNRLEVEITESVFLDGEASVIALLHGLRSIGVRVALDDFGTGYSSLSYLRSFPFDKIKIDRSFVTNVADDASSAAIVRAIVELAGALNMETTAEGVEDADQLARLRGQGCSSIQGYFFSRPVESAVVAGPHRHEHGSCGVAERLYHPWGERIHHLQRDMHHLPGQEGQKAPAERDTAKVDSRAVEPVPPVQLVAGGDPAGGADVSPATSATSVLVSACFGAKTIRPQICRRKRVTQAKDRSTTRRRGREDKAALGLGQLDDVQREAAGGCGLGGALAGMALAGPGDLYTVVVQYAPVGAERSAMKGTAPRLGRDERLRVRRGEPDGEFVGQRRHDADV